VTSLTVTSGRTQHRYDQLTARMAANPEMDVAALRDMLDSLCVLARDVPAARS
jgi:hypothetical protein